MKTFKQFLQEAPIKDYETIGNWDKAYSFRDKRDRMLIRNPRSIEMVKKKFGNTDFVFNFYFVNTTRANKFTEIGMVKPKWVEENLGKEVYDAVSKNLDNDSINVVFTNNKGEERMPMTAWIMAHRIGHAAAKNNRMRTNYYYQQVSDTIIATLSQIMECYGKKGFPNSELELTPTYDYSNTNYRRKNQLIMKNFFQSVCTFKSARDKNLRDWFEVTNELIAQYLTTGKIKFNPAPQSFGGRDKFYLIDAEEANELLQTLSRDLTYLISDLFGTLHNNILVM